MNDELREALENFYAMQAEVEPSDPLESVKAKGGRWPIHAESMEVHPAQIELAKKLDRDRGAPPTDYDCEGRPVWTSEDHKRKFNRAHGVHDNNSYYG